MRLVWEFALDSNEKPVAVEIYREHIEGGNRVEIASSLRNNAFNSKNNLGRFYRAELPSQLVIFNVDNVKEYRYILEVRFTRSVTLFLKLSTVRVEVYGKWRLSLFRIHGKLPFFLDAYNNLFARTYIYIHRC